MSIFPLLPSGLLGRRPQAMLGRTIVLAAMICSLVFGAGAETTYEFRSLAGAPGGVGFAGGAGPYAHFREPAAVALDAAGNLYVADRGNNAIRRITPAGVVFTLTGLAGTPGSGDGSALAASFSSPLGLVVAANGEVFVADTTNATIRKISPEGQVTTWVGQAGQHAVVDGVGTAARLHSPGAMAIDPAGNLYVVEVSAHVVRKISPTGAVTVLAGAPGQAGYVDGPAASARFNQPMGIAVNRNGTVYVADSFHGLVRTIGPDGTVGTLAGAPGAYRAEDGTGTNAKLKGLKGLAIDAAGNLYASNDNGNSGLIRKITPDGVVTTLAGGADYNPIGNSPLADGWDAAARFSNPQGLTVDGAGNIYVADLGNHAIRKVTPAGEVSTVAGGIAATGSADGGASAARFLGVGQVAVNRQGDLLACDTLNSTIRRIAPDGTVTTLAGSAGQTGTADGAGPDARFYYPNGAAIDAAGELFVADSLNHTIRKVSSTGVVTTWAGAPGVAGANDGPRVSARFNAPHGLGFDAAGNLYVADGYNYTVRKITPAGEVSTLAGQPGVQGDADGVGSAARFRMLGGLAVDGAANVYIADEYNRRLRKVSPAGEVTTLAVEGQTPGFSTSTGLAVDATGTLFSVTGSNHVIQTISPAGAVKTIGGVQGVAGVDLGIGTAAYFTNPRGIAIDAAGRLYISNLSGVVCGVPVPVAPAGPPIVDQTLGQFVPQGAEANFSVSSGSGAAAARARVATEVHTLAVPVTYRWQASTDGGLTWSDLVDDAVYGGTRAAHLVVRDANRRLNGSLYRCLIGDGTASTISIAAVLVVDGAEVPPSQLVNIATRAYCETGDRVTIGGFVVGGSGPKTYLIRAVGPTLGTLGIPAAEALKDPVVEVHDSLTDRIVATNDNWGDNANAAQIPATAQAVGATPLAGSDAKSAALLLRLDPGVYTFVVKGQDDGSGIVLLEVYDAEKANLAAKFVNIATRAYVKGGDRVAIGGFVVVGNAPKRVLLRAVGPTLATYGLKAADLLADPVLELHDSANDNALVTSNDDWGTNDNAAAIVTTGARIGATAIAASDTKSAALLLTLAPGIYTAIAKGKDDSSGIVLVEVYDAD